MHWRNGRFRRPSKICSASWGLPTSTGDLFLTTVRLPLLSPDSILCDEMFCWSLEAHNAFIKIKQLFTSAPILIHPDPSKELIVEVNAFDAGVGAVLSQYVGPDNHLHPCTFFSSSLSPTEHNYDVGNQQLLALKIALEDWRHWLEGAKVPFLIWTDHKNLSYIQAAKKRNSCQARWALLLSLLSFHDSSLDSSPGIL